MKVNVARNLLWPVALAVATVALTSAVLFRRSATARTAPSAAPAAPAQGVVCFGTVDLEAGVTSLFPLQGGRVAEVLVRENQAVAQGAEILRLDDKLARSRLAEADAGLELSRIQSRQARKR